jgi:hypothetical protein
MVFHSLHNLISILELLLIGGILLWVKKIELEVINIK